MTIVETFWLEYSIPSAQLVWGKTFSCQFSWLQAAKIPSKNVFGPGIVHSFLKFRIRSTEHNCFTVSFLKHLYTVKNDSLENRIIISLGLNTMLLLSTADML